MRHLWSLLAGVVAAPLTWLLIAVGQDGSSRTVDTWVQNGSFDAVDLLRPAVYLAVAGILLGLIATLRLSPLGPLVAGLLLVGSYAALFVDPLALRDALPADRDLFGDNAPLRLPLDNGTVLLIGALLLMAVFSAQRWRHWPTGAAAVETTEPEGAAERTEAGTAADYGAEKGAPAYAAEARAVDSPAPAVPTQPVPADRERESETPWSAPPKRPRADETE
jgi:hypothetical protein